MKIKLLLFSVSLLGYGMAHANNNPDPGPAACDNKGKKDDLIGMVIHADTRKPLKDVNVTAYLASKKEKSVITDEVGNYSFEELKPGSYKFVFEKAGYKKVTKEKVIVKSDDAFQINIEMLEAKDFELVPSPMHFVDF
ncbi:MAG: carboxypeptidase regulatory-like domain-containing protein [Chitinophagaceae bacterium]|nr:carboxypeptidase regulatory-like domain-containing protein [Chitinophagaceae bacterium]